MGYYADAALQRAMGRGTYDPISEAKRRRKSPVIECPICSKGIRPIAGCADDSLRQHMKAKHPQGPTDGPDVY